MSDGEVLQTINHTDRITFVTYSSDSQFMVTGSVDKSLKVWEAQTGKLTQVLCIPLHSAVSTGKQEYYKIR